MIDNVRLRSDDVRFFVSIEMRRIIMFLGKNPNNPALADIIIQPFKLIAGKGEALNPYKELARKTLIERIKDLLGSNEDVDKVIQEIVDQNSLFMMDLNLSKIKEVLESDQGPEDSVSVQIDPNVDDIILDTYIQGLFKKLAEGNINEIDLTNVNSDIALKIIKRIISHHKEEVRKYSPIINYKGIKIELGSIDPQSSPNATSLEELRDMQQTPAPKVIKEDSAPAQSGLRGVPTAATLPESHSNAKGVVKSAMGGGGRPTSVSEPALAQGNKPVTSSKPSLEPPA